MSDVTQEILDDGGYLSRKYLALVVYFVAVTCAFGATVKWPGLGVNFQQYWMALSAGLATYFGVNWGHSFLAQKSEATNAGADPDIPKPSNM